MTLEEAGGVALIVGQPERAEALFEEAAETARALQAAGFGAMHRRYHPGSVAYWRGDAVSAIRWYEEDLALTRENEHTAGIAENLAGLGRAVLLQGDAEQAVALLEESLRLSTERASKSGMALALHALGLAAMQAGDRARATSRLRESLTLRRELDEKPGIAECLEALAAVLAADATTVSDAERALRWLGAVDALRERMGAVRPPVAQPTYDAAIDDAGIWLDDTAFAALAGGSLPLDDVVADALSDGPVDKSSPSRSRPTATAPPATISASPAAPAPVDGYPSGLTGREVEVLRLIAAGRTNDEIAAELILSPNTVRHHVTHILTKTGVENRAGAAAFAFRHNLV
jgi:DNA-binding CsgD family transcriptional regulator/tetratricopeptide (TPR) repeat protein